MFRPFNLKSRSPYPFTLILENDNTALLGVGRPIDSAGRYVVNVIKSSNRVFTSGGNCFPPFGSDKIR